MYSQAKVSHTVDCDKCKIKILLSEYSTTGNHVIELPTLNAEYSQAYKDLLGFILCWKCFESYRGEYESLYYRLHKDIFGYDPRGI